MFRNTSVFIFCMTLGPGILHFCCVYCFFSLQFEMVTRSVMPQTQLLYFSRKYSRKKKHLHQSPFNISSDFAHACALTIDSDLHRACNLTRLHAVLHREQLPQPLLSHHHQYVHQRGGGSCFSFSAERILSEFWYLKEERQSDWVLLITSKPTQHFTTYLFNFLLS